MLGYFELRAYSERKRNKPLIFRLPGGYESAPLESLIAARSNGCGCGSTWSGISEVGGGKGSCAREQISGLSEYPGSKTRHYRAVALPTDRDDLDDRRELDRLPFHHFILSLVCSLRLSVSLYLSFRWRSKSDFWRLFILLTTTLTEPHHIPRYCCVRQWASSYREYPRSRSHHYRVIPSLPTAFI